MENRLQISNLKRTIMKDNALNVEFTVGPVDLNIEGNQLIGVFGKNGSGKTTFIQLLLGIKYLEEGSILFNGESWFAEDLAYIPDTIPFSPRVKVSEVLKIHKDAFSKTWDEDLCQNYLIKYDVDITSKVSDLSLGMGQRLMVAIALSHKAKILVLDEPMEGIDPFVRSEILDDIIEYTYENESLTIISTHNTVEVNDVVDHVLYFEQGYPIINSSIIDFSDKANILLEKDLTKSMSITEFVEEYQRRNLK